MDTLAPDKQDNNRDEQGRFAPGTSGNISGRPKGSISIRGRIREKLEEIPEGEKETYLELIVRQILDKTLKGDFQMLKLVWEQIDGRPRESVDVSGDKQLPIPILSMIRYDNQDDQKKIEELSEQIRIMIEETKMSNDKNN